MEVFSASKQPRPIQPLGEWTRIVALSVGLTLIGCGVMLLGLAIGAYVWEGGSLLTLDMLTIYASIYFGLAMLGLVVRDYRLVHYGLPSRQLTAEEIGAIRRALEDQNWPTAIKVYRRAVPGAGLGEAQQFVIRLFEKLRTQEPNKFLPPTLSLTRLNWNALLICASIEAVILAVWWFMMPPSHPGWFVSELVSSVLLGIGSMAGTRVKSVWQRLLLLTPALAAFAFHVTLLPRFAEVGIYSLGPFISGYVAGSFLVLSAFNRRRRSH